MFSEKNKEHEWDGVSDRRSQPRDDPSDWYKYKYMMLDKLEMLEKTVKSMDEKVGSLELSFVKLQTKIMMVSGLSGFVSAAVVTAVLTAIADKIFGK